MKTKTAMDLFNYGILDSLDTHVAIINASGIIVKVNKTWNSLIIDNNNESPINLSGEGANYFDICKSLCNHSDAVSAHVVNGIEKLLNETLDNFYFEYPCHSLLEQKWFCMRAKKIEYQEPLVLIEHQNITAIKKTEQQLKELENRVSELFHLSQQPMWVFDNSTLAFVQVNKAATELYGYTEEDFLNMSVTDIMLEADIYKTANHIEESTPKNRSKRTEMHYKKSGEMIEVEIYSTPIKINDNNLISVIAIDVTEKKQFDYKIIKTIIKIQEDERYEIGSELHDNVCQILAASQLNLGVLKDALPPSKMEIFDQCEDNIRNALTEVNNLSHKLAPIFFKDLTMEETFIKLFNSFNIDDTIEISLHVDETINKHSIKLELQLNLYRILQEQFKNILKYADASYVEVDVMLNNNTLIMKITDDGIGFNIETITDGMGLANIKKRAELFAGKLFIDSLPGKGCTMIVEIPV